MLQATQVHKFLKYIGLHCLEQSNNRSGSKRHEQTFDSIFNYFNNSFYKRDYHISKAYFLQPNAASAT